LRFRAVYHETLIFFEGCQGIVVNLTKIFDNPQTGNKMDTYSIRKELIKKMNEESTTSEQREQLKKIGQMLLKMDTDESTAIEYNEGDDLAEIPGPITLL